MNFNRTLLLVLIFNLLLSSCSSDDSDAPESIPGTYAVSEFRFNNDYDFNRDGVKSENVLDEIDCSRDDRVIFNADNTGMIIADSEVLDFYQDFESTDTDNGITIEYFNLVECIDDTPREISFTWEQTGANEITINTAFLETLVLQYVNNSITLFTPDVYFFEIIENGELTGEVVEEDTFLVYTKL